MAFLRKKNVGSRMSKRDTNLFQNKILSKNVIIDIDHKNPNVLINRNTLVIGSAGSGKTSNYVFSNIMQAHSSYVITDPKGEIYRTTSKMLRDLGYTIKVFNLVDMQNSSYYNPLKYIHSETDVFKLVETIISNTNDSEARKGEKFWEDAEKAVLQALILYIYENRPVEERNMNLFMEYLDKLFQEKDSRGPGFVTSMFNKLRDDRPNCLAVRQWNIFMQAEEKTRSSILLSLGVRLGIFNAGEAANILSKDTVALDTIGDKRTALFVIISDVDETFNVMASMMYTQMFQSLVVKADKEGLVHPVRCILDEFANIGVIPGFVKGISTWRSRGISVDIIIQDLSQLQSKYTNNTWKTITSNCDSLVFLGGVEHSTLEWLEKKLGKETIDYRTTSQRSMEITNLEQQESNQITGRSLMFSDEIEKMQKNECLVFVRGHKPMKDQKYFYKNHKRFKYLEEGPADINHDIKDTISHRIEENVIDEHDLENITVSKEAIRQIEQYGYIKDPEILFEEEFEQSDEEIEFYKKTKNASILELEKILLEEVHKYDE